MKKTALALLLCLSLLLCGCSAERTKEPKICTKITFYTQDDRFFADVYYTQNDEEKSECFSGKDARELCAVMLSGDEPMLYKSVRFILMDEHLSEAQKREIAAAYFSRTEFQLQSTVYDSAVYQSGNVPTTPLEFGEKADLAAYYRKVMNTPSERKGGI